MAPNLSYMLASVNRHVDDREALKLRANVVIQIVPFIIVGKQCDNSLPRGESRVPSYSFSVAFEMQHTERVWASRRGTKCLKVDQLRFTEWQAPKRRNRSVRWNSFNGSKLYALLHCQLHLRTGRHLPTSDLTLNLVAWRTPDIALHHNPCEAHESDRKLSGDLKRTIRIPKWSSAI